MRPARRLGQTIAPTATQDDLDRGLQTHPVADGDVDRLAAPTGADRPADDLVIVDDIALGADLLAERPVPTGQERLGAADGGAVEQHPQMAGDPQPARVGQAVAVDDEQVGRASCRERV